jgi:hypothetical protein
MVSGSQAIGMDRVSGAERLLRRLMLADPRRVVDLPRLDECLILADEVGATEGARALRALAAMQRGYAAPDDRDQPMTARARLDLADLMRRFHLGDIPLQLDNLPAIEQLTDEAEAFAIGACGTLDACLRTQTAGAELQPTLERLGIELLPLARIDLTMHADLPTGRLLRLFAIRTLQDFLQANHHLAYAPLGSAALLHAAARLSPHGLGCYFRNTAHVTRNAEDVVGLVEMAMEEAGVADDLAAVGERWVVPMAAHLQEWKGAALASVLGDLLWLRACRGILRIVERRMAVADERDLLRALRDAGLDNADVPLAIYAQWLAATLLVHSAEEWVRLGDLRVIAGDHDTAEIEYRYAQGFLVNDNEIQQRLDDLRDGRMDGMENGGGFDTLPGRRHRLLARAGLLPSDPPPMIDQAAR